MDLSNQFDLASIPEPQRTNILTALTETVLSRLTLAAYDKLSSEDKLVLDRMDESSTSSAQILEFLEAHVPDLEELTNAIIIEGKAELTAKTQQLADMISQDKSVQTVVDND